MLLRIGKFTVITFIALFLQACGLSETEIATTVKQSMSETFLTDANLKGYNLKVLKIDMLKKPDGTYKGIAEVDFRGVPQPISVDIVVSGKQVMWEAAPGSFLFLMEAELEGFDSSLQDSGDASAYFEQETYANEQETYIDEEVDYSRQYQYYLVCAEQKFDSGQGPEGCFSESDLEGLGEAEAEHLRSLALSAFKSAYYDWAAKLTIDPSDYVNPSELDLFITFYKKSQLQASIEDVSSEFYTREPQYGGFNTSGKPALAKMLAQVKKSRSVSDPFDKRDAGTGWEHTWRAAIDESSEQNYLVHEFNYPPGRVLSDYNFDDGFFRLLPGAQGINAGEELNNYLGYLGGFGYGFINYPTHVFVDQELARKLHKLNRETVLIKRHKSGLLVKSFGVVVGAEQNRGQNLLTVQHQFTQIIDRRTGEILLTL